MTNKEPRPCRGGSAGGTGFRGGGAEGIRTPDLLIANETRYQLRHSPDRAGGPARGEKIPPGAGRAAESGSDRALLPRPRCRRPGSRPRRRPAAPVRNELRSSSGAARGPGAGLAQVDGADGAAGLRLGDVGRQGDRQRVPQRAAVDGRDGDRVEHRDRDRDGVLVGVDLLEALRVADRRGHERVPDGASTAAAGGPPPSIAVAGRPSPAQRPRSSRRTWVRHTSRNSTVSPAGIATDHHGTTAKAARPVTTSVDSSRTDRIRRRRRAAARAAARRGGRARRLGRRAGTHDPGVVGGARRRDHEPGCRRG